jgi:putative membrane protein
MSEPLPGSRGQHTIVPKRPRHRPRSSGDPPAKIVKQLLAVVAGFAALAHAPAHAHHQAGPSWLAGSSGALGAFWLDRPDIAGILMLWAIVYVRGWARLRRRAPTVAGLGRLCAYVLGITAAGAALLSPITLRAGEALPVHMVQHLLLTMLAAPLIMLGNPFLFVTWGLPRAGRRGLGRLLHSRLRHAVVVATALPVAWTASAGVLWLWHAPSAYDAALAHWWLHDAQHLTFFVSAALLWYAVIGPAPRLRRSAAASSRVGWLFAAMAQNAALAIVIAVSERVLYRHYLGPAGPAALADQQVAGILMLVSGTMMYVAAALLVAARLLWSTGLREGVPDYAVRRPV